MVAESVAAAGTDLVSLLRECLRTNVADLTATGHVQPLTYRRIALSVADILARLGKVAGLAAGALAWPPEALSQAVAEDPDRFTTLDSMMDADVEEDCYPPKCYDSRSRAIICTLTALEFSVLLFSNIKHRPALASHECASDAFTLTLGKHQGALAKKSICTSLKMCLGDRAWFFDVLGTTEVMLAEHTDAIIADSAVLRDAVTTLYVQRNFPVDFPNAVKSAKRRPPYRQRAKSAVEMDQMEGTKEVVSSWHTVRSTAAASDLGTPLNNPPPTFYRTPCATFANTLNNPQRPKRFDFGPSCRVTRCTTCRRCSLNRGDRETRLVHCRACFATLHTGPIVSECR